jgi:hypothetical protein
MLLKYLRNFEYFQSSKIEDKTLHMLSYRWLNRLPAIILQFKLPSRARLGHIAIDHVSVV